MNLIISFLLLSLISQASGTQCFSFYNPSTMGSEQPANVSPFQFANKVLSALNQLKGSHSPYEFYQFVKDSLKRKNQISNNLDIDAYQKVVALEISQTDMIGENYLMVQEAVQGLIKKIQEFKKSELSKNSNSPKQIEEKYEALVVINQAFATMKNDLAKIEKDQSALLRQQAALQQILANISNVEKNHNLYVNEFSEVYGHMIMEQSQYPAAANRLASIGNHFNVELQAARAESEKLRGLKLSLEIPLATNSAILKLLREKSYTDLESFFVEYGFTPELAASLLAEYAVKKEENSKEELARKAIKAEQGVKRAKWKNRLVGLTVAFGAVGGLTGGYEKIVDSRIEQNFAQSVEKGYSFVFSTSHMESLTTKYFESRHVPGEMKAIVKYPEQVFQYLQNRPKNAAMTPEMKLFLLSYAPKLFRNLKFENFMSESLGIISGILDAPQTRNFNNNERKDLEDILSGLKSQHSGFSKFVDKQTGIFTNGDPATLQATSDKFFSDRSIRLIKTPFQTKWETQEQLEAWVESNVDPKLKEIFENKDQAFKTRILQSYLADIGSIGNIEFFYLLKNLKNIPAELVTDDTNVNGRADVSAYLDSNLSHKTDFRIDIVHRFLRYNYYVNSPRFSMAPLTPLELNLAEKYIAESSKTWIFGKPGYTEKVLAFFNISLKEKSEAAKTMIQK